MLDETQEEEEDEKEDKCNEKRWTNKIMLDEMQEEEEEEEKRRLREKKKKKKKRHTTKLSYRSSEGRSSSRRFRKCRNYDGKSSIPVRKVNIPTAMQVHKTDGIRRDIHRCLKN